MYILSTLSNIYKAYTLYNNITNIKSNALTAYNICYGINTSCNKFVYRKFIKTDTMYNEFRNNLHDGEWQIVT